MPEDSYACVQATRVENLHLKKNSAKIISNSADFKNTR